MKGANILRDFAKYASFNVLGMIAISCYILADTFFISQAIGTNGLTALNLVIPVYSLIHGSGLMLGMGGGVRYSVAKSQQEGDHANRLFTNTVVMACGLAVLFFALGLFFSGPITEALGADRVIFPMGKTYLQIMLLFAPLFIFNNIVLCFVRNDGAPQLAMLAMLGGSLSNIALDYIFMFPLDMGMFGAALATGLAPAISLLILSSFFRQEKNSFHLVRVGPTARLGSRILSSGIPSLITELSSGIVILVFNGIILRLQGNVGVAAYGVVANLSIVVLSIYTGIAQGIQPLISRNYGVGNRANVQRILRYALISMAVLSAAVYAAVSLGAPQIAGIFNSEQNAVLQSIAVTGLRIYFTACIFAGFNIIISVYFTSIDRAYPAHIISLLRGFIVIIPMAFLLSALGGMTGIWLTFPAAEMIVAAAGCALYFRKAGPKPVSKPGK